MNEEVLKEKLINYLEANDLRNLYLYFKEEFDRIIEKEKGEML